MKGRIVLKYRGEVVDGKIERVPAYEFFIDGEPVTEAAYKALFPDQAGLPMMAGISHAHWPQRSKAFAVHRKQVKVANARNERLGLSTRYDDSGVAIIPDRAERTRLSKAEGFFDNDAGYGDFAGNGPKAYNSSVNDEPDLEQMIHVASEEDTRKALATGKLKA
jgi:hypothetical protein